jgi:hypothetical protein
VDNPALLSRRSLVDVVIRAANGGDAADERSAIAHVIRRVAAASAPVLRRVLVGQTVDLLALAMSRADLTAVVDEQVDGLVALGDLLVRATHRSPRFIDVTSGALVTLEAGAGAVVLGRADAALPDFARDRVQTLGIVRVLPGEVVTPALRDEVEFQGCTITEWRTWCGLPEALPALVLLTRATEGAARYAGDGDGFSVFDPRSDAWMYRDRFRPGAVREIVARDGWAAAHDDINFGTRSYSLFSTADGAIRRSDVRRDDFVRVLGACAVVANGHRLLARRQADVMRLHFPPPRWLARLLCTGSSADLAGALLAIRVPDATMESTRAVLETLLFCEIRAEEPR